MKRSGRTFKRTTMALVLCVALLVGIGIARTGQLLPAMYWVLCTPMVLVTLRRRTLWTLLWIAIFGLSLGWWRGSEYMLKLARYDDYFGQKVMLRVTAQQDAAYNKYKQLTFDARNVVVESTGEHLKGKISVGGFGENAVFAGDEVLVFGKLKPSLGSYQGRLTYAQLETVAHHNSIIGELRRRFTAGMQSALPEPLASFGMGLLIGQRNTLPVQISQTLLMVGLTHIIAVSGYNLTILLRSAERLSGKRSKRIALLFGTAMVAMFLLFAGASASIVRAAIVSMLSIIAGYYGRQIKPLLLILLAAVITGFASPFYVWSDASWYLSFLAFYGVMILGPLVSERWPKRLKESVVAQVALESLCAEIMTLPFILHSFGQMSLVGLIGNVLVVALVPLAMLLGMIAGLAGMLVPAVAGWLAWPAQLLLTYMLDAATLLSRIPHIFLQNIGFSLPQMIISYVAVAIITWLLWWKQGQKPAKISLEIENLTQPIGNMQAISSRLL